MTILNGTQTTTRNGTNRVHPVTATAPGPPENIEAEKAVLCGVLLDGDLLQSVRQILIPGDFSRPQHADIFAAACALTDKGEPVDLLSVQQYMETRGTLPAGGGLPYLAGLFNVVTPMENVPAWAGKVKETARLRQAWENAQRTLAALHSGVADMDAFFKQQQADLDRVTKAQPGPLVYARRKPLAERVITMRNIPDPPTELPYLYGPYFNIGAAHWITGSTGLGKTTVLFNLLPALAEGRTLWGIECKPTRILYLDMESGEVGRSLKAQRLFTDRASRAGLDNLLFMVEPLRLPDELPDLLAYVQAERVGLVVFDTVRRCFSVKDENDNAEVYNRVVPTLDALKGAGVATLTIGHPSKAESGRARGAGAQEDAGDVNLSLTMHRGEVTDADGIIALRVTKNRLLGLDIPPLLLRRVGNDQFRRVDEADAPPPEKVKRLSKKEQCAAAVIAWLRGLAGKPVSHGVLLFDMKDAGFAEATANRALNELVEAGAVVKQDGGGYVLPATTASDALFAQAARMPYRDEQDDSDPDEA